MCKYNCVGVIIMGFDVDDLQVFTDAAGSLFDIVVKFFGIFITIFMELVIDYLTGNIISNVYIFSFFLIILATTLILYLKFVSG